MPFRSIVVLLVLAASAATRIGGQASLYEPTADNLKARQQFQDAEFGLFIHWGIYSTLADGEWVMNNRRIPAGTRARAS